MNGWYKVSEILPEEHIAVELVEKDGFRWIGWRELDFKKRNDWVSKLDPKGDYPHDPFWWKPMCPGPE